MKRISLAAVVACVIAGTALGVPQIQYTLELGGDNQVLRWEDGWNPPFIPGSPADGRTIAYDAGPLTWDAVVALLDPGTTNGVANLVFSLKLYKDSTSGDPIAEDVFYSTMNDGDEGGLPMDDPLEMADFCHIYDVPCVANGQSCTGNGPHDDGQGGPGRLFDSANSGGPCLDRAQYPSTISHGGGRNVGGTYTAVGGATSVPFGGMLVGMGAGYSQFNPVLNGGCATAGVGISPYATGPQCDRGLGHLPNFEGQIDVSNLNGTYILKLVPGAGNNILRGDFNCMYDPAPSFAVAVAPENVLGDEITFVVEGSVPGPCNASVTQWASVRNHGGPSYGITAAGGPSAQIVETRNGGVQSIVVDFSAAMQSNFKTIGDIVVTKVWDFYGTGSCFSITGVSWPTASQMVLTVTGGTHSVACQVDLSNAFNCTGLVNPTCTFRNCEGNINGDVKTDLTDVSLSKSLAQQGLPASTYPNYDANLDGNINLTDMALIKSWALGTPTRRCSN